MINMTKVKIHQFKNRYGYCEKIISVPDLPEGANNVTFFDKDYIYVRTKNDEYIDTVSPVMPDIVNVSIIENNGEKKVIRVDFADGDTVKSILSSEDTFNLEQGISVCITKKLLNDITHNNGSSTYNKIVNHCLKVYKCKQIEAETEKRTREMIEAKRKKYIEKRKRKMERKRQAEREEKIAIQEEAYLRAMRRFNNNCVSEDDHR